MLKRYLLSELTRVFGKYVDGLDDESLQVGVWSGKIELTDVKLRKDAIDKLRLPVTVRGGYLKKLDVDVPWTSITSAPVTVNVDTVVLLLCPNNVWNTSAPDDAEEDCYSLLGVERTARREEIEAAFAALSEERRLRTGSSSQIHRTTSGGAPSADDARYERVVAAYDVLMDPLMRALHDKCGMRAVTTAETVRDKLLALDAADNKRIAEASEEESGMWSRLGQRIKDNLKVTIKNVHIRFEVSQEMGLSHKPMRRPIAVGITLDRLRLQTTDDTWEENVFVDHADPAKMRHRLLSVQGMSLYCENPVGREELLTSRFTGAPSELGRDLKSSFDDLPPDHGYLLEPVDTEVQVKFGIYPNPQYAAKAVLGQIHLALSQHQAEDVVDAVQVRQPPPC